MSVIGVAIENLSFDERQDRFAWLESNYGKYSTQTWYIDYQPMVEDLVMREDIFTVYMLKWGNYES